MRLIQSPGLHGSGYLKLPTSYLQFQKQVSFGAELIQVSFGAPMATRRRSTKSISPGVMAIGGSGVLI